MKTTSMSLPFLEPGKCSSKHPRVCGINRFSEGRAEFYSMAPFGSGPSGCRRGACHG